MATKDISDVQVLQAFVDARAGNYAKWSYEFLAERTGQAEKVCYRAMERASNRGLVEYGVSLRTAWLTGEGKALLAAQDATDGK